jgi:hypothetical protein
VLRSKKTKPQALLVINKEIKNTLLKKIKNGGVPAKTNKNKSHTTRI